MLVVQRGARRRSMVRSGGDLGHGELSRQRTGGERRLQLAAPGGEKAPHVGQAGRALAGAGAGQGRPLDQLELAEPVGPDTLEVGDLDTGAGADRAGPRAGRDVGFARRVADDTHGQTAAHPRQGVPRVKPQAEGGRVAGASHLGAVARRDDHRLDPPLALEADDLALETLALDAIGRRPHRHHPAEVDAGAGERRRRARRQQARELRPRRHRLDLGGAGGDDDLASRVDGDGAPVGARQDQWPRVDPGDLLAAAGVEHDGLVAGGAAALRLGAPGLAGADDHDVAVNPARLEGRRQRGVPAAGDQGRLRPAQMMPLDDRSLPRRHLAGPRIADAVHRRQTVRAVPGEAEASAAGGMEAGAQQRHEEAVARRRRDRALIGDKTQRHGLYWIPRWCEDARR